MMYYSTSDLSSTISVEKLPCGNLFRKACQITAHGRKIKMPLKSLYKSEHSPIRTQIFWIELRNIPTFVSVHLVRHKMGVEHFVESNRDDLYGSNNSETRLTPINHAMLINAQGLINICRKRLCYKSHKTTVGIITRMRKEIRKVDPDLYNFLLPECVYRNGFCPEIKECSIGLKSVMQAYKKSSREVD